MKCQMSHFKPNQGRLLSLKKMEMKIETWHSAYLVCDVKKFLPVYSSPVAEDKLAATSQICLRVTFSNVTFRQCLGKSRPGWSDTWPRIVFKFI